MYWTFSYSLIVKFDVLYNTHKYPYPNWQKGKQKKKEKTSNSKQAGAFVYVLGVKNRNSVYLISVAINKVVLTGSCFLFGCSCLVLVWPTSVVHSFLPIPRQVRINWLQYEIRGWWYFFQKGNNIDTMSFSCFLHLWIHLFSWHACKRQNFLFECHVGSFSRSAVNNESGAKTGLTGVVMGIIMACALLFLTPLFEYIPQVCCSSFVLNILFVQEKMLQKLRKPCPSGLKYPKWSFCSRYHFSTFVRGVHGLK